ncbi:hypothetical protein WH87_01515 [Devosia epidermidihirudinis]|uniref:Uncharacterized protein n=1 Tax=Devosia epidermidihirudinis TaxID=1293439 RepID=A0A0F5QIQ3_9HYPH|nr:hypothetical protein WH87_01515 [Devosia epidermidihirudinis]
MTFDHSPYEGNEYLAKSPHNLTIFELRQLDDPDFWAWAGAFRKDVVHAWDELGVPVTGGRSADEIVDQFRRLATLDVSGMSALDDLTGTTDCILNNSTVGSVCNQFFPTMLKTKDIDAVSLTGISIYSMFADDSRLGSFVEQVRNMLVNDPFSFFSHPITMPETVDLRSWLVNEASDQDTRIWFSTKKAPKNALHVADAEMDALLGEGLVLPEQIVGAGPWHVRRYNRLTRIMDIAKMFRHIAGGTPATNFRPSTAKHLYLRFTEHISQTEKVVVYDPSAGWGGRILGAMACGNEREIHYLGTDPNPDHWMPDLGITKYEYLANYFHGNVRTHHRNTCEIFRVGSEDIADDPKFQAYRGKVDFVFTSPPYFAAEGYSDDPRQSHMKFRTYEAWRDGFLKPTLETSAAWLKENRFVCINIADVRVGDRVLPLQNDASNILLRLGLAKHPTLKMVMSEARLGSKETDRGTPTMRNFCKVNGQRRKYEPILVFQKLIGHDKMWAGEDLSPEMLEEMAR